MEDNFKVDDGKPIISREYGIHSSMYDYALVQFQKKYVYPVNCVMTVLFLAVAGYNLYCLTSDMENMIYGLFIIICLALTVSMWHNLYKARRNLMRAVEHISDDRYKVEIFNNGITVEMFENDIQQSNNKDVENSAEKSDFQHTDSENVENSAEKSGFQHTDNENVENKMIAKVDEDFFAPPPQQKSEKTEIRFASNVAVLDKPEIFMVCIKKSIFYIIPKKAFSEEEILIMQKHFENRLGKNYIAKK